MDLSLLNYGEIMIKIYLVGVDVGERERLPTYVEVGGSATRATPRMVVGQHSLQLRRTLVRATPLSGGAVLTPSVTNGIPSLVLVSLLPVFEEI